MVGDETSTSVGGGLVVEKTEWKSRIVAGLLHQRGGHVNVASESTRAPWKQGAQKRNRCGQQDLCYRSANDWWKCLECITWRVL